MTTDERMVEHLRAALPRADVEGPSRDLWPLIVARGRARTRWSWLDLAVAALLALVLLVRPGWLPVLAFHL
jgi:hypothetical protein